MDAFGFAEIVSVIPKYNDAYFLPGMRNLFLRSG